MKPEQETKASERAGLMRAGIIAMVAASPSAQPRRRKRSLVIGGCALLVTGLLAGGGISAAAFGSSNEPNLQGDLQSYARFDVKSLYGKLLGHPHYVQDTGKTAINLGARPKGASAVEIAFRCLDAGVFTLTIDGESTDENCGTSASRIPSTQNADVESITVTKAGNHVVSMDSHGGGRYALWVSWLARVVLPASSPQQDAELSDGKVTRQEYVEAWNRYQGCMAEAGFPMSVVPLVHDRYAYGLSDAAVAASDKQCYPREFGNVDTKWQDETPQATQ